MKIGRTEKCWLAAVFFFWVFYNFPGFPAYGNETEQAGMFLVDARQTVFLYYKNAEAVAGIEHFGSHRVMPKYHRQSFPNVPYLSP